MMITRLPQTCTHERGPGTTTCLRCRQEERARAAARRQKSMLRGAAAVMFIGIVGAIVWTSMMTYRRRGDESLADSAGATTVVGTVAAGGSASAPVALAGSGAVTPPPSASPATEPEAAKAPLAVRLGPGRTVIDDSVVAVRTGDTVVVHFDTEQGRTRRADKFDRMLRWTLPRVFGSEVSSILPEGVLASPEQLTASLPETGIHLDVRDGWKLSLWPMTREGRDGPLVIAYRAVVSR